MEKFILKSVLCTFLCFSLYCASAQEVVSSGGDHYSAGGFQISWTMGEVVIETFIHDNYILTQGFQQSFLATTPSYYWVTFLVTHAETDAPIEGAEIILFHETATTLTTDASGEATIDLYDGSYTYQVEAEGYVSLYDAVFDVEGADLSVFIPLTPEGESPTVLDQSKQFQIRVFPNPVKEVLHIRLSEQMEVDVILSNLFGQIVYQKSSSEKEISLPINQLNPAIYILRIVHQNQLHSTHRIIKK